MNAPETPKRATPPPSLGIAIGLPIGAAMWLAGFAVWWFW